ncbi:MAG: SlyX family protein [Proteobacteria bacterium]|nr:SlyX family protein [Pseudomonadota bacterium]
MEDKIVDLETRIAFLENAQQQLSDVIARQESEIAVLVQRAGVLEQQLRQAVPSLIENADNEPPPHY